MGKYFVFFVSAILAYAYSPNENLDLYRYYENALLLDPTMPLVDYVENSFAVNFDFVYFATFLIFKKIGIPKEFVTSLYVGLFYSQSIVFVDLIKKDFSRKPNELVVVLIKIFAICTVTPIVTFSISRSLAAFALLLTGINVYLKNNKWLACVLFVFSVFTHVFVSVYLIFMVLFYYSKVFRINNVNYRNFFLVIAASLALTSAYWIDSVIAQFSGLSFFDTYGRYAIYLDNSENQFGTIFDILSIYDTVPILTSAGMLLFGLVLLDRYNNLLWVAYCFCIIFFVCIGFSASLTQRTCMFILPFQGMVAMHVVAQTKKGSKVLLVYYVSLFLCITVWFMNIYSYREFLF